MRIRLLALAFGLLLPLAPCCGAASEEKASGAGDSQPRAAGASEPERDPARSQRKKAQAVPLYTNEDLERMFGPSGASKQSEGEAKPQPSSAAREGARPEAPRVPRRDPLEAIEEEQAREADRGLRLAEAEREVAEAAARVKELEKRALAIRNPFLPRPELPPEEAEAWKGLSNEQRLERTEAALAEARRKLEEARARLAALQ